VWTFSVRYYHLSPGHSSPSTPGPADTLGLSQPACSPYQLLPQHKTFTQPLRPAITISKHAKRQRYKGKLHKIIFFGKVIESGFQDVSEIALLTTSGVFNYILVLS